MVFSTKLDSLSHVSDVFREKRVLRCLALLGIPVWDPQVALGDGGNVVRLEGVVAFQDSVSSLPWDIGTLFTAKARAQTQY